MREQRWAHLLCGPVEPGDTQSQAPSTGAQSHLESRVEALENEVALLRSAVQNIYQQLGMSQPGHNE